MPSASETQSFQQSWQQTAAWAQSKGIKYNQYYPVYQLDSSRLLQYGASGAMSTAERERAIQAAADPTQAFQSTPSTSANPLNIIHNTITDARNIFTGLGDIAIHPLHNGLVDSVKNTFDLIDGSHKLQGGSTADKIANLLSSTVLSWVPGAADLGQLMQADNSLNPVDLLFNPKGLEAEAEHPISSILDILPIANKLAALKVAASAGEAGGLAERAGMVVDEGSGGLLKSPNAFMGKTRGGEPIAERISVGRVAKGLLFNKELGKLGPEGELLKGEINPATNKLMTVGDTFHKMTGGSMFNANPDIADVSGEYAQINQHWTTQTEYLATPFKEATQDFDEDQKVELGKVLAKSQKVGIDAAVEGVEDPRIIQAVEAMAPIEDFSNEMALSAEDGVREITNPRTGQVGIYSLRGHPEVFAARDAALAAEQALAQPLAGIRTNGAVSLELNQMLQRTTNDLEQAKDAVRPSDYTGNIPATKILGRRRPTPTGKAGVLDSIVGPGGDVDRLLDRMREGEYETVRKLSKLLLKRMDNWSPTSIEASGTAPAELQALRAQVQKAGETADALITARSKAHDQIIGKATKWTSSSARDSLHREAVKSLDSTQKHDAADLVKRQDKQDADLHKSWTLKRKEIATRFAQGKADREHALADGISNINDRYDLAVKEARTAQLLARRTFDELQRGRQAQGLPELPDIPPGAAGSPEAIDASVRTLEAHRTAEKAQLAESTARAETEAVREEAAENASTDQGEALMQGELKAAQAQDTAKMQADQQKARDNLATKEAGRASRDGPLAQKIETYLKDQKAFEDAIWAHPSDNFQPVLFDLFAKNLLDDERGKALHAAKARSLMETGWGEEHLDQLHANKQVMATLVQLAAKATYDDPFFEGVDTSVVQDVWNTSLTMLEDMAKPVEEGGIGLNPKWIHHVSATKADADKSLTVKVKFGHGTPPADVLRARDRELSSSKFDIMASLTEPMMQFARRAGFKDFVENSLDKHIAVAADLKTTFDTFYRDLIVGLDRNGTDYLTALDQTLDRWNLTEFDPESKFGIRLPRWGDGKVYIDKDLLRAVEKMAGGKGALEGGLIEYGTKLFRFSILGLSPRYTAHITLGGTFLLALREPLFFTHIPELLTRVKDGTLPETLHTTPTQMGTDQWEMLDKPAKLSIWNKKVGQDTVHYEGQEELAKQGIDWKKASPIQWLKALGNLNLRFTSLVNDMQKGLAYLSGEHRGLAEGMTQDRATLEGLKAAEAVYGDLRRMSPFERDVARTIMPFYGWEKHILQYVMSYPADHPWRAMMLANIAEYDTAHSPGGLPSRYQFLFSLGSPDAQGNVTAIDLRSVNPLRDVANYATLQGFIGALNPAITSVAAEIDPDIIYGGNTLYPNLTYDQFYGIEEAGPQGNLLTSAEQFVPQLGAMQSALAVAGQRQGMSDAALLKNIGEQLNFPWVPQHINLRQEAAKTAIAQYQVTKNLAATAWQTGNFQPISDLGSVPDPRNADYETPVSDLEQLYSQLAQQYPGQAPSDTATPLPSVHL